MNPLLTKQAEISPEDLKHLEYKRLPELEQILKDNYYNSKTTEDTSGLDRMLHRYRARRVSDRLTDALRDHKDTPEISSGTAIPRSTLSLDDVSHEDLRSTGFVPSYVAVPERGQTNMRTYRHPYSGMHVHEHKKNWMFHRDKWPSLSMLMKRYSMDKPDASIKDKLGFAARVGIPTAAPHIIHEGLPGYINFTNNSILGSRSWEDLLEQGVDSAAPMRLGRSAGGVAAGALGLAGLGFLGNKATGKNKGDQFSLLRGAGTVGGFMAGNSLGSRLHQTLKDQGVKAVQGPGWTSTALLAGLPLLGAYGGHRLAREFDGAEEEDDDAK